jgi:hypothetical protein
MGMSKKNISKLSLKSRITSFMPQMSVIAQKRQAIKIQTPQTCPPVPFKHFLDSKCLRQLKASAAIKDCLFYEGVNLLLAS